MPKYNQAYIKGKEIAVKLHKLSGEQAKGRIPPGQTVTQGFPILDLGIQPEVDLQKYRLHIYGLVEQERLLTWEQLMKMPKKEFTEDLHCVTRWSKLDVKWKGIPFKEFLKIVKPKKNWKFLIQEGLDGYTTNVSREDVEHKNVFLAYVLKGKPIPKEHGGPMRLIIPHLYGWKGSKFLSGLKFVEKDEQGFWEVRSYHNHGDAFKEERYA
ncbi:MAG: sulfite oxidase-like oxidoreductase [Nanoarchaeota archaeon]